MKTKLIKPIRKVLAFVDQNQVIVRGNQASVDQRTADVIKGHLLNCFGGLGRTKAHRCNVGPDAGLTINTGQILSTPAVIDVYSFPVRVSFSEMSVEARNESGQMIAQASCVIGN